ncbi:MAG: methyltransferase domain-containing protein [Phycisphaerae bacterium]|nr:methyltransferase domain-containing protein [Phycisphaerae bacterium]NUQ44684.1 methyltransferase domain-containing protein [Phycisphaerae bacterium]
MTKPAGGMNTSANGHANPTSGWMLQAARVRDAYTALHADFCAWNPSPAFRDIFRTAVLDDLRRRLGEQPIVRVLDIGCGHGTWAEELAGAVELAERRIEYLGIDLAPSRIEAARQRFARRTNFRFETADADAFDPPHRYDLLLAIEVLVHVPAQRHRDWLHRWHDWLRPGGYVVIIDKDRYSRHALRLRLDRFNLRYLPGFLRRKRPLFPEHFAPLMQTLCYPSFAYLARIADEAGFHVHLIRHRQAFRALTLERRRPERRCIVH